MSRDKRRARCVQLPGGCSARRHHQSLHTIHALSDHHLPTQIDSLRTQLNTRQDRITLLETRLLAVLDTLDDLQTTSAADIKESQRENERLTRKLNAYKSKIRAVEQEKEDMGNAVMLLVKKGESAVALNVVRMLKSFTPSGDEQGLLQVALFSNSIQ